LLASAKVGAPAIRAQPAPGTEADLPSGVAFAVRWIAGNKPGNDTKVRGRNPPRLDIGLWARL
jgi:hypothetical protein